MGDYRRDAEDTIVRFDVIIDTAAASNSERQSNQRKEQRSDGGVLLCVRVGNCSCCLLGLGCSCIQKLKVILGLSWFDCFERLENPVSLLSTCLANKALCGLVCYSFRSHILNLHSILLHDVFTSSSVENNRVFILLGNLIYDHTKDQRRKSRS